MIKLREKENRFYNFLRQKKYVKLRENSKYYNKGYDQLPPEVTGTIIDFPTNILNEQHCCIDVEWLSGHNSYAIEDLIFLD